MTTPVDLISNLVVGTVDSVSADEVRILLELDAPHTTALNAGTPTSFPRINSYVLLPHEAGATVSYVTWIGVERSPYPKRSGFKDFGLVDLPFPLRKMAVVPVGTLTSQASSGSAATYSLTRGVNIFPSVGDHALIPTPEQLDAIVGGRSDDKRVRIGSSPMGRGAPIMVDPNKLFGRHLAVLGNTGSGKSCTVAGLIRWSMSAAQQTSGAQQGPNARFVVLDPNGEYAAAFRDQSSAVRVFRVPPVTKSERPLDVPAWLWSGHEWSAVSHAQPGAQRPLLMQGLRDLKAGSMETASRDAMVRRYLLSYAARLSGMLGIGTTAFAGGARARFECARLLETLAADCAEFAAESDGATKQEIAQIAELASGAVASRKSGQFFNDFSVHDLETVRDSLVGAAKSLPEAASVTPISEDAPLYFDVNRLAEHLERVAVEQGGNLAAFISTLGLRIRSMLADPRLGAVIARDPPARFDAWLEDYIGASDAANGQVAIIDLSLVPSEVVHIVVAVLARLVFEALQRYRRVNVGGLSLPTVLVLEEAHTFIRRGREDDAYTDSPSQLCREAFERIAREGRKFGLGLLLSSQRPSELSPTVLAQCNTFLLHRIVNDGDQALVARLVPDNVGGLLKELPSLPSRHAILLGWAAPIPVLVEIDELASDHRPRSADPEFWEVWTRRTERTVDWNNVVNDWAGL